ncbi:hypothetical protein AJ88_02295 [Mesorhizobium amorphae CCBAU 01583]|nr:hypothetical protein AJ88_02295 [Mesorhizobium amorphae CCBAU 01583]
MQRGQRAGRFGALRLEHADIGLRRRDLGVGTDKRGLGLIEGGLGVVELRLRADMRLQQLRRALLGATGIVGRGLIGGLLRLSLLERGLCSLGLRVYAVERLAQGGDLRLSLGYGYLVVAGIDRQQRVAGLDLLVLVHLDLVDIAGNLRRDERHVGLDIGVVG